MVTRNSTRGGSPRRRQVRSRNRTPAEAHFGFERRTDLILGRADCPADLVHLCRAEIGDRGDEQRLRRRTEVVKADRARYGHAILGTDLHLGVDPADRTRDERDHDVRSPGSAASRVSTTTGRRPSSSSSSQHLSLNPSTSRWSSSRLVTTTPYRRPVRPRRISALSTPMPRGPITPGFPRGVRAARSCERFTQDATTR